MKYFSTKLSLVILFIIGFSKLECMEEKKDNTRGIKLLRQISDERKMEIEKLKLQEFELRKEIESSYLKTTYNLLYQLYPKPLALYLGLRSYQIKADPVFQNGKDVFVGSKIITSWAVTRDSTKFAFGYNNGTILIWNIEGEYVEQLIRLYTCPVVSIEFNKEGTKFVSGSHYYSSVKFSDKSYSKITLYELVNNKIWKETLFIDHLIRYVGFTYEDKYIYIIANSSNGDSLNIHDLETSQIIKRKKLSSDELKNIKEMASDFAKLIP